MAIMLPLFSTDGLNMKESLVAAEVNFIPIVDMYDHVYLYPPLFFFLPVLGGITPHTLE